MGRIVKIIIYALIILALWFCFSYFFKSCGSNSNNESITGTEMEGDFIEVEDANINDEFFEEEPNNGSTLNTDDFMVEEDMSNNGKKTKVDEIDYSSIDEEIDNTTSTKKTTTSLPTSNNTTTSKTTPTKPMTHTTSDSHMSNSSSSTGTYLVIAGSYLVVSNAQSMTKKLKKLGYTSSEVIKFDSSEFHTVSAGRYEDYDAALNASAKLRQQGIESYVHRRKI